MRTRRRAQIYLSVFHHCDLYSHLFTAPENSAYIRISANFHVLIESQDMLFHSSHGRLTLHGHTMDSKRLEQLIKNNQPTFNSLASFPCRTNTWTNRCTHTNKSPNTWTNRRSHTQTLTDTNVSPNTWTNRHTRTHKCIATKVRHTTNILRG